MGEQYPKQERGKQSVEVRKAFLVQTEEALLQGTLQRKSIGTDCLRVGQNVEKERGVTAADI